MPESNSASKVVLNREFLDETCGGDEDFVREVLNEYLTKARSLLGELQGAVSAGNVKIVREASHSIKGSSRTIGAELVGDASSDLEEKAKEGDLSNGKDLLTKLEAEHLKLEKVLKGILAGEPQR